jgi:serine/threonine protein kinase
MPAPSTSDELLDLVRKSGVLEEKRLDTYLEKARAAGPLPSDPAKLARQLIRDGILTNFQAEQFLQGRWRRFTIGKYKVLERIGTGGMGSVYLCEHKFMRRRAAVKVLPTAKAADPSALERFYREGRAVAALDHPNIVRAYDIDQEDKIHFLVMEYVDGASLQEIVKKSGPLDAIRAAHYISQAAQGLQHAHEVAGLVHRDIKPGNLIADRSGTVKVLDMGLARFFYDEEDLLTKQFDENVLGTADYLAPEQALDSHAVDIRADIYGLGATFYFLLTGRTPFSEGTVAQKLIWHQTRQPRPIESFRSDVPEGLIAVIAKMMAKDPAQRYQMPIDVVEALAPWTQTPIPPPETGEMPKLSLAALATASGESMVAPAPERVRPPSSQSRRDTPPVATSLAPTAQSRRNTPPVATSLAPTTQSRQDTPPVASSLAPTTPALAPPTRELVETTANVPPPQMPAPDPEPPLVEPADANPPEDNGFFLPLATAEASPDEDSLPWENLAAEMTKPGSRVDSQPRSGKKKSSSVQLPNLQELLSDRRRLWLLLGLGIGGLLLLVLLLLVLWWVYSGGSDRNRPSGTRLLVSRSGSGENLFRTVHDAVRKARPHDHIVVLDEFIEDPHLDLNQTNKYLTLEAEPGKTVEWCYPDKAPERKQLLVLSGAEGVTVQGFVFDGRDRVDQVILLTGQCPGLTLRNVEVRGFKQAGILIANCAGKSENPVSLRGITARTSKPREAGITFNIFGNTTSPRTNEHITIEESHFLGDFKSRIQLPDPDMINDSVRFDRAFLVPRPGKK